MRCPECQALTTKVIDSRPDKEVITRNRRYECLQCRHRFSTIEILPVEDSEDTFDKENDELRNVIGWLLRSIFSDRMNNDIYKIQKMVSEPSTEMRHRINQLDIDISAYQ